MVKTLSGYFYFLVGLSIRAGREGGDFTNHKTTPSIPFQAKAPTTSV